MKIGVRNSLKIVRIVDIGAYLADEDENVVLLPKKELDKTDEIGKILDVFLYRDSKGRLISTKREPKIYVGMIGKLEVKELSNIGAFLDIGLERDVLLPFREMIYKPKIGEYILTSLYVDKSNRLAATMRIYSNLKTNDKYEVGDIAICTIYEKKDFGYLVAIDNTYFGRIPMKETYKSYNLGEELECRIIKIREDKKLDVSPQQYNYIRIDEDAKIIYDELIKLGGKLDINEQSDAELIKERFHISKSSFKRAIGRLLKTGKIKISTGDILLNNE